MKRTHRALISSVISLLLCISMLVGTTFAWFTDTVVSGKNRIIAGNLDVELDYLDDNGNWKTVKDSTSIFDENALWEPGYTEVVYLRISNLGSLALKYQLAVNVVSETGSINVYGQPYKLSDYIEFGAVEGVSTEYADRDAARADVADSKVISQGYTKENYLLAGDDAAYVALVVYMPESVGNEANYRTGETAPKIELGISVVASQYTEESDSFGDDYDEGVTFPEISLNTSITVPVKTTDDHKTAEAVTLTDSEGGILAQVPAGVQLEEGVTEITLTVTKVEDSAANIELGENEISQSVDVHIEGVAEGNTVPILVTIEEMLPIGLNIGNYTFYHVEDGITNQMTLESSADALDVHNEFTYDAATGDVTMALAGFSEVAVTVDTDNVWNGVIATTLKGSGTEAAPYIISNADELAAMSQLVSSEEETYGGAYYKLISDVNFGGSDNVYQENAGDMYVFYPIGYWAEGDGTNTAGEMWYTSGGSFSGTFDGNGNTISGIFQNTWVMNGDYDNGYWNDAMGLFGYVNGGTVKNLTIDNFVSEGEFAPTGCVAAYASNATFENISLTNCHPQTYNTAVGGIVGLDGSKSEAESLTFKNITVDQTNTISALWGTYDCAAGGLVGWIRGENNTISFDNCHVSAVMDVYNDVCANYQYYWYRYCGMFIGTVQNHTKDSNGYTIPNLDGITATNCTVTYGDWNEYWYCELVANTKASYTHDHQFSRLTEIGDVSEIQDESGNWNKAGNYVIPQSDNSSAVCYHIVKNEDGTFNEHKHDEEGYETINGESILVEDRQRYYIPFNQLFTGYGWGVKAIYTVDPVDAETDPYPNIQITINHADDGGLTESVEKFASNGVTTIGEGTTVSVGELFKASGKGTISGSTVQVFVSPVGDDSTVSAVYTASNSSYSGTWQDGTLAFTGTGSARVVITDYYYCTPTVITVTIGDVSKVDKFVAVENVEVVAGTTKALGELFEAIDGAYINSANVSVTITGVDYSYSPNMEDWTLGTINFNSEGKASITIAEGEICNECPTTITVVENTSFAKVEALVYTEKYLYRVGNRNAVKLGSLFMETANATINGDVSVMITSLLDNKEVLTLSASKDAWKEVTFDIDDDFTGPIKVTIDAVGAKSYSLNLEVVDAYNVTSYSELSNRNSVLLKDITMSSGSSYYLSGASLYGNGFTFDVTDGAYIGTGGVSGNYVISIVDAALDNIQIVGAVYTKYGATTKDDYNRPTVLSAGNCTIVNCYISNCAAPVRVNGGNLEIINSTLKGGNFANLDIRNGHVILDNVTTINQVIGNDIAKDGTVVVGLGVVVYYENVLNTTTIEVKNGITQYNHLSETQANTYITDDTAKTLTAVMYNENYEAVQYNDGSDTWVNTGILSMTETVGNENITNVDGYVEASPSMTGITGYLHTKKPDATSIAAIVPTYETVGQGAIAPSYSFDYTTKNYAAKTDGSNDYCYEENGTVYISMDAGDTFNWDTSILTATKNGQTLAYTVSMNNTDYTGKSIAFNTAGNYTVTYTYTDSSNYGVDSDGNLITYSEIYTKTVKISVAVIEASAKNAEFTMGSSGADTEKITIDNVTYISATGVTADNSTWTYITIGDQKIYYPIVAAKLTSTKGSSSYAYFPVFENVVSITDYADSGTGSAFTYNSFTTALPSTLTAVKGVYKAASDVTNWYNLNNSHLTQSGASKIFKWASSSDAPSAPETYNNVLCYKSPQISADRAKYITLVQYSYTDATNTTYYYYVGYTLEAFTKQSVCVTPDTLVTMADGSTKEIQHVSLGEEILTWNFYTGQCEKMPVSLIQAHETGNMNVLHLYFEDGTELKVLGEHGIFDADLNTFIFIDEYDVESYVGHSFIKQNGDSYTTVKLTGYEVVNEYTTAYTILSAEHYNAILEDMLTVTPAHIGGNFFNPFEIGEDMKYVEESMRADIEKYGLYTYEDFADYITYDQFVALNLGHFRVSVAKGLVTYDGLIYLIENFINNEGFNVNN